MGLMNYLIAMADWREFIVLENLGAECDRHIPS